jgi:hypothetical protein
VNSRLFRICEPVRAIVLHPLTPKPRKYRLFLTKATSAPAAAVLGIPFALRGNSRIHGGADEFQPEAVPEQQEPRKAFNSR